MNPRPHIALKLLTGAALVLSSACSLAVEDFAGKTCAVAADCPSEYSCVETGPSALRTCERISLPLQDAKDEVVADPADWCNDVKPLMLQYCAACHGASTAGSGIATLRLDRYDDRDGQQGAFVKADRIRARTVTAFGTAAAMPPPAFATQPVEADKDPINRWFGSGAPRVNEGAPDCTDD